MINAGAVTITSVTVGHLPSSYSYYSNPSWVIVQLSAAIPESMQSSIQLTYTAPPTGAIADHNGNSVQPGNTVVWGSIYPQMIPSTQSIQAYVNPTSGTLGVELTPAIFSPVPSTGQVILKKDGVLVPLTYTDGMSIYNGSESAEWFAFTPDTSNTGSYTVEIATGLTAFADSPFGPITATPATIMPNVTTSGITAQLSSQQIILNFPTGVQLFNGSSYACSFILNVDSKRVLVRGNVSSFDTTATIYLSARTAALVASGTVVTISYDPSAGGHTPIINGWLTDLSGAFVPAFGPVTVS